MNSIYISGNKKKYIKKTFLNYNKKELIENLKHEIFKENLEKSYFLLFDMINSGFFKDIWILFISTFCEYIHILNPNILQTIYTNYKRYEEMRKSARLQNINILEARNEFNFRKILFMILKKLVKSPKKHIGHFIPQSFNNQNKISSNTPLLNAFQGKDIPNLNILKEVINNQDYQDVEHAMKEFHHFIEFAIHKKMQFDQQMFDAKEKCFFWLAKILVIGAEQTNIIGYPYNISLYHSVDPNSKDYFSPLVWNILLNASKILGKDYFNHIITLYKIFNSNLLQSTKRENFLILQSSLLFFEYIPWIQTQTFLLQEDYDLLDELYNKYQVKPKKTKVKLKSQKIIENTKDDMAKLLKKREEEVKKLIPPPSHFFIQEIKKSDKPSTPKKRGRPKKKKEGLKLPDIFYIYHPPSKNDIKKVNEVKYNDKQKPNHKFKPISISSNKKTRNLNNTIFSIKKIN